MEDKKALLNLILDRRSCRSYQPQLPERSLLTAVVEAGRYATTAMNRQLTRFTVLTDPARLARLVRHCKARMEDFGPGGPLVQSADQSTGRVTLRFPGRAPDGVLSALARQGIFLARTEDGAAVCLNDSVRFEDLDRLWGSLFEVLG